MPRAKFKAPKKTTPLNARSVTPLIYYGGKSRDSDFIISQFPPHKTFVDGFGGGGAITFAKGPSGLDIYNDIGNVSNFYRVLRDYGEELYEALYYTPFSREEFQNCLAYKNQISDKKLLGHKTTEDEDIEWARCWYVVIMESFSHEEMAKSWKVTKTNNLAQVFNNHVNELPRFTERLKNVIIENLDIMKLIRLYDTPDTLFYLDPPYVKGTRSAGAREAYVNEMDIAHHKQMLDYLVKELKGQAVVSMYSYPMYDEMLKDWRRLSITHESGIKNSSADNAGTRTEVLWIKEFAHGLWSQQEEWFASPNVAGL